MSRLSEASMLREIITLQAQRIAELEDKHWSECVQIAQYDDEARLLRTKHAWRSVTSTPPKQYENVIVCTKSGRVTIAARHAERAYFTPALHRVEHVTHWMPLPEVPQYE